MIHSGAPLPKKVQSSTNFTNGQWSAGSPNLDLADEKEADQRDDDEGQREVPHQLLGDDLNTDWMNLIAMTFF